MKTLKLTIINKEGEKKESPVSVSSEVFGVEGSSTLVSMAVRRYLANQRKARAIVKTRSFVDATGAKIWRQKGTGRARHGDKKAPIFVGGGVSHGPTGEQNYKQGMNKKMIQKAIFTILSEKVKNDKLFLLDNMTFEKVKETYQFVKKLQKNFKTDKKIAFLLAKNENLKKYLNNLDEVFILNTNSLDPYNLLRSDYLFLTHEALEQLEKVVSKENNASKS